MKEALAVEVVEKQYGSIEEFAAFALLEAPELFEPGIHPDVKAEKAKLDPKVISYMLTVSPRFASVVDRLLATKTYNVLKRERAMQRMANVADGTIKAKHKDRLEADSHLRRIQGNPLGSDGQRQGGVTILINTGKERSEIIDVEVQAVDAKGVSEHAYVPPQPGDAPPKGILERHSSAERTKEDAKRLQSELAFYEDESLQAREGTTIYEGEKVLKVVESTTPKLKRLKERVDALLNQAAQE